MGSRKDKVIDLSTLDGRELAGLQEQLDAEVQNLTQSAMTLQRAAGGFGKSGRAIEQLAQQKEGVPCIIAWPGHALALVGGVFPISLAGREIFWTLKIAPIPLVLSVFSSTFTFQTSR